VNEHTSSATKVYQLTDVVFPRKQATYVRPAALAIVS